MQIPMLSPSEEARIEALHRYGVLDTEFESAYDELTKLASEVCEVPVSLISLIDTDRQWFKSSVGTEVDETAREISFCGHAILERDLFEIKDASQDERFADNPLVADSPNIRFYAGAQLVTPDGHAVGTLCVIDTIPRELTEFQRRALKTLANQVISLMELRLSFRKLQIYSEKVRDLNASKDKFFSVISHDLRSPFTAILSFSDVLRERIDPATHPKEAEIVGYLQSAGKSAFDLVNNLLKWAQAHTGQLEFEPEKLVVAELVDDVIETVAGNANSKQIELSRTGRAELSIFADRSMMFSALQNLATNSLKFTREGGSVVFDIGSDGDKVVISVADSGVGMSEQKAADLFKVGEARSTVGTDGEEGTGIGLMLVKEFVEKQGGKISVESVKDEGTTILLTFPPADQ